MRVLARSRVTGSPGVVLVSLVFMALCGCGGSGDSGGGQVDSGAPVIDSAHVDALGPAFPPDAGQFDAHDGGSTSPADAVAAIDHAVADASDAVATDGEPQGSDSGVPPDGSTGSVGPYGVNGPSTVTTATFQVTAPADTFSTTAYIPSAAGPHPVVILMSGFEQTAAGYAPYATRLASWGVVTLLRDDPGLLSSLTVTDLANDVGYEATTWLAATGADSSTALYGKIDTSKIGLAGHSRGGQVTLLAGEGAAKGKIQGVFGLDPVDTSAAGVEARTSLGAIGVPVAFIGETTDSTGGLGGMPCAPAADNYLVLYSAASSPTVAITAINADHTMFEDASACTFCALCTAGTANQATVLSTSVRYLTAFFARVLLGDASVGAAFAGAGANQDVAAGIITIEAK
jgi:dienelactone hydrolase